MKARLALFIVGAILIAASVASSAARVATAKLTSALGSGQVTVRYQVPKGVTTKKAKLTLSRSLDGSAFVTVAQFEKITKATTFTEPSPGGASVVYQAALTYLDNGKKKRNRTRSSSLSLNGSSPDPSVTATPGVTPGSGPGPTPTPDLFAPTATPTAAVNPYFDSAGNVNDVGKILFQIPSILSANRNAGSAVWSGICQGCHGNNEKTGRDFAFLKVRTAQSPMFLTLSDQQLADVTAYLNRFRQ